jgi:hypothetical protein
VDHQGDIVKRLVLAAGVLLACHDSVDPRVTGLTSFGVTPDTVPANAVSEAKVTATVDTHLPTALWSVTFTSTAGVFAENGTQTVTQGADATGHVTVYLRAPRDSVTATVTATADTVLQTKTAYFALASVDSIRLVPAALNVMDSVQVTAYLRSNVGFPSPGVQLMFTATDSSNKPTGQFTPALPSDTTNVVIVQYYRASSYTGAVTIAATAPGGAVGTAVVATK